MTKEKLLKDLEDALSEHDWWYAFSSDRRAYLKGLSSKELINSYIKTARILGWGKDAELLHKKYSKEYDKSFNRKF